MIAQRLDPGRRSHLAAILGRRSPLPVRTVTDQAPLENGVVYVVPANRHVEITDHVIGLRPRDGGRSMPSVDLLLSTAAPVFGENLIAVILTGTGSDGAAGARAVKEAGGMVVIQNPETAQFAGMPAAIAPPLVDVSADLEEIGPLLHGLLTGAAVPAAPAEDRALQALLDQLHQASRIDFSQDKTPTIQRRMAATGMRRLADYQDYLQDHPEQYARLVLIQGSRTWKRAMLMTAAATILALIPQALSGGGLIVARLTTVVIGGLLSSTLLPLVVIPVIYSLLVGLQRGGAGSGGLEAPATGSGVLQS